MCSRVALSGTSWQGAFPSSRPRPTPVASIVSIVHATRIRTISHIPSPIYGTTSIQSKAELPLKLLALSQREVCVEYDIFSTWLCFSNLATFNTRLSLRSNSLSPREAAPSLGSQEKHHYSCLTRTFWLRYNHLMPLCRSLWYQTFVT